MNYPLSPADVQGLGRLALDTARLITDVVEHEHATILAVVAALVPVPLSPFATARAGRTGGIPGLVYRSIHAGYDVAEGALRVAGALLPRTTETSVPSTLERERTLAILNGIVGDHLAASGNPLAIEMALRCEGVKLDLEADALLAAIPAPGRRLLVLAHGLCMNDLSWQQDGHDHGAELAAELGYTPLYLHYNTGLHVSTNGKRFAELLERLVGAWPEPVEELAIVGHSMGGLVARSATHYGTLHDHAWRPLLRHLVFLGAPHHGSWLERAGHLVSEALDLTPYSAPFRRLGASRSAGITDLRHGNVLDEDWRDLEPSGRHRDCRRPAPLPPDVRCYTAAVTLGTRAGDAKDRVLGDGLVPLESALGLHRDPQRHLAFPDGHSWVGYGMGHGELLRSPVVYAQVRGWLGS